jgi:hypothetical protein
MLVQFPAYVSAGSIYPGGSTTAFVVEVATFGLVAYAAAIPISQIAQGLILPGLTRPARWLNAWRFNRKYDAFALAYGARGYEELDRPAATRAQHLYVYLSDFPIERDAKGVVRFERRHATRVGNIIATYEQYPDSRYGLNAEGFWSHILLMFPSDVRKELDSVHAIAIGTLASAAAGWRVFSAFLLGAIARGFHHWAPSVSLGPAPLPDRAVVCLSGYGLAAAILFNYLSRVVHRDYGRLYRAAFDLRTAEFGGWIGKHRAPLSPTTVARAESFRRYASTLDDEE